ncbi:hypothetical protein EYF80_047302 [Liparis tanakae]|uniref:Uncharacterized protein n=1 Tax=Liparis tanakae TaxID=230148 RepID=A0A4Z2FMP8_9TELE|nr:hypothetical protein EYF80_047302 [Liparis tanakae]
MEANSSSSASILSFSPVCACTTCFSRNCTCAKWEVSARSEEFSRSCSPSSFSSRAAISSSVAEDKPLCFGWPRLPLPLSSSGVATAPTGAHRSPALAKAASLSEADSSSVDIVVGGGEIPVESSRLTTSPVCQLAVPDGLFLRRQPGSPPEKQV